MGVFTVLSRNGVYLRTQPCNCGTPITDTWVTRPRPTAYLPCPLPTPRLFWWDGSGRGEPCPTGGWAALAAHAGRAATVAQGKNPPYVGRLGARSAEQTTLGSSSGRDLGVMISGS